MGAQLNPSFKPANECHFVPAKRPDSYVLVGDVTAGPVRIDERGLPERGFYNKRAFQLRIIHLNDLHGHVTRATSHGDVPVLSRVASHIQSARDSMAGNEDAALLVLSAGDDIGGSALDLLLSTKPEGFMAHPMYRLMAGIGLNASAVGNHDLDFGLKVLRTAAGQVDFPFLSANLTGSSGPAESVFPAVLYLVSDLRVGIIGLTTPTRLKRMYGEKWTVADPVDVLSNLLPAFQPLCDVVILLSHLGYQGSSAYTSGSAGDIQLARRFQFGGIDLIIGGHSHVALNDEGMDPINIVNGIPIVQAGAYGRLIGDVTLTIRNRKGRPQATLTDAHLVHTAEQPIDEAFEVNQIQPLLAEVQPLLSRAIAPIEPDPTFQTTYIRQHFDTGELALANFVTDAIYDRCHEHGFIVDLVMIDNSVMRAGLPDCEWLSLQDWFRIMPFTDAIECHELTGRQLLDLLCDNTYRLGRWDEPSVERGFAHFSRQIRYSAMHGRTRRDTILLNPLIRGVPLAERLNHRFLLATHSHFRASAAAWEKIHWLAGIPRIDRQHWPVIETELSLREECLDYMQQHGGIKRSTGARLDGRLQVVEPDVGDEYRYVFHQPPFPRPGDGGRAEAPAEHRHLPG